MADRLDEAVGFLRQAHAAHLAGDLATAMTGYRRALVLAPPLVDAEHFLAVAWLQSGDAARAAARFASVSGRRQRLPDALINLGNAAMSIGGTVESARAYRRAVAWAPAESSGWIGLGNHMAGSGDLAAAAAGFGRAVACDPSDPVALGNRGSALAGLKRPFAARWHRRAIAMAPAQSSGWINVGHAVRDTGEWDAAGRAYRRAHALAPGDALALSESIHADLQVADWRSFDRKLGRLRAALERGGTVPPFHLLALDLPPSLKRANAERWSGQYPSTGPRRRAGVAGPLRLGYLSGDFRRHAVAYEIVELIEQHRRNGVALFGYSWMPGDGSEVRRRLEAAFGGIVDLGRLDDAAAADRIAADGIDVLIDLAGYTHGARPGIVARRPAPVQVSYFGFPGSTGASFHDYVLVDDVVAPAGHDGFFREAAVRLPGCYWPHDSTRTISAPPDRAAAGLPADALVLACFNQVYKIQPATFGLWMRMLREIPNAVLWLLAGTPGMAVNLRSAAAVAGIEPSRLIFAPQCPLSEHLARLKLVDLVVDTLPYNAHTTASDALAAGCPVVTRIGADFAGRVGASMLVSIGLSELATASDEAFVACVVGLGRDAERRRALRARLARRLGEGPFFDTLRLGRSIEAAAAEMRRRSARGESPSAFSPKIAV